MGAVRFWKGVSWAQACNDPAELWAGPEARPSERTAPCRSARGPGRRLALLRGRRRAGQPRLQFPFQHRRCLPFVTPDVPNERLGSQVIENCVLSPSPES